VRSENIVALCDCDENQAAQARQDAPHAKFYFDYREMLEKEKLDAVTVSTPDHHHAPASILAMRRGLHVYCQKPLTHSVWEARQMTRVAREMKVATQMGNQGTADNGLRRGAEIVRAGCIGDVTEVHIWTNRPGNFWSQGRNRPDRTDPVPPHLKWDLFLGPAPDRPYVGGRTYHPFAWRGWWDFGTGALGDMACHTANLAFMAVQPGPPSTIDAQSSGGTSESPPLWSIITFEFPASGSKPGYKFVWYDGDRDGRPNMPPADLLPGTPLPRTGSLIIGTKGKMLSGGDYGEGIRLLPEEQFKDFKDPEPTIPRNKGGHYQEWIAACKGGPPAMSNFDYAGPLTELILLGNLVLRTGKKLQWDPVNLRCPNCPEASQYIKRQYRKGWEI
jgi:predicted dehydrogenase